MAKYFALLLALALQGCETTSGGGGLNYQQAILLQQGIRDYNQTMMAPYQQPARRTTEYQTNCIPNAFGSVDCYTSGY